jgi:hypothetical protein
MTILRIIAFITFWGFVSIAYARSVELASKPLLEQPAAAQVIVAG